MPERKNITLYEGNLEKAALVIIKEDTNTPQDISAADIEVYIKDEPDTPDVNAIVLSTQTTGVVKTAPLLGQCQVTFPDDLTAGTHWWRVDVILSNQRKTAVYGSLYIENT